MTTMHKKRVRGGALCKQNPRHQLFGCELFEWVPNIPTRLPVALTPTNTHTPPTHSLGVFVLQHARPRRRRSTRISNTRHDLDDDGLLDASAGCSPRLLRLRRLHLSVPAYGRPRGTPPRRPTPPSRPFPRLLLGRHARHAHAGAAHLRSQGSDLLRRGGQKKKTCSESAGSDARVFASVSLPIFLSNPSLHTSASVYARASPRTTVATHNHTPPPPPPPCRVPTFNFLTLIKS
jgi:hypothetical protein